MVDLEHFHQSTINISTFQTNDLLTKIASSDIKQNWKPWQTTTVYAKKHKKQSTQPTKLYKTCKNPGKKRKIRKIRKNRDMAKNGEIGLDPFDPTQFEKIEGVYRGPSRASRPLQHPVDTRLSTPLPVT